MTRDVLEPRQQVGSGSGTSSKEEDNFVIQLEIESLLDLKSKWVVKVTLETKLQFDSNVGVSEDKQIQQRGVLHLQL